MFKTKLGISVGLMGSIACVLGAILGLQWPFLAIVAYILFKDENEWLRRITLKVTIILLAGAVITLVVPYVFGTIYDVIDIFLDDVDMLDITWTRKFSDIIVKYTRIIIDVVLIFMGLKALKQGHVSVKAVDNLISKNV